MCEGGVWSRTGLKWVPQKGKDHRPLIGNEVQGKRKKGGIWVEEGTILCDITCEDGSVYHIPA